MRKISMTVCSAIFIMTFACGDLLGRGQTPPPPPFSGGNIGAWLGSGPIFGFEDGGGANGGWGGGYFELDPWRGWGSGAGGSGGGYGGQGGGGNYGNGHTWGGDGKGGHHGTCWVERLPGRRSECACAITYDRDDPPPQGTLLVGYCRSAESDWYYTCSDVGDLCTGFMP